MTLDDFFGAEEVKKCDICGRAENLTGRGSYDMMTDSYTYYLCPAHLSADTSETPTTRTHPDDFDKSDGFPS